MRSGAFITTSWDDGHPSDWRVAELLAKHGVTGTFYVPRAFHMGSLLPTQVKELASEFEVGAHTINHTMLTEVSDTTATREITESRTWLSNLTGCPVRMFCPPRGKFSRKHLRMASDAGFLGVRSVELMSFDLPHQTRGVWLLGTTIQAYPHTRRIYLKNSLKRHRLPNVVNQFRLSPGRDWLQLLERSVGLLNQHGGVLHLWGHSWEIDSESQWSQLDEALKLLAQAASFATCVVNSAVIEASDRSAIPNESGTVPCLR